MSRMILGTPCKIGKLEIKNRIVMEAMGNGLSELNGDVSSADIAFYEARAKGGVGLIMSEAVSVDSVTGRANPRNMCIDKDAQIAPLAEMMKVLHKYDCKYFVELYHPGRQGVDELNTGKGMFAPSDVECQCVHQPIHPMTKEDIDYLVDKFVSGAVRSQKAGCDGVLLHAAHGYILTQFLSPYTNKRTDEYGGSAEGRAKIVIEIIGKIRERCGEDFPIGIRLSACEYLDYNGLPRDEGITLELSKEYVRMFEAAGVDLIDVSSGIYETMNTSWEPVGFEQGWKTELAAGIKEITTLPVVCTSVIRDPMFAEQLLEDGVCDFVGSARQHFADPDWSNKALAGMNEDIRPCISCLNCMKTLSYSNAKCAINALGGRETEFDELVKDGDNRKVVIIGGGPAGMEAARVLATRGFSVKLYEQKTCLGGLFRLASLPPCKAKMQKFNQYLETQIRKLGVEIALGVCPTSDDIKADNPYAVLVAAGTDASMPPIEGLSNAVESGRAFTVERVLDAEEPIKGKKILVLGGGMSGLETAEYLDAVGNDVSVYEMLGEFAHEEHFQNIIDIMHRIGHLSLNSEHKLVKVDKEACEFELKDSSHKRVPYDYIVIALGMRGKTYAKNLEEAGIEDVHVIGTNKKFGSVAVAIADAFEEAYKLK